MLDKLNDQMFPWQPIGYIDGCCNFGEYVVVRDCDNVDPTVVDFECFMELDENDGYTHFMTIGTPEKLAAALRIAVGALERVNRVYYDISGLSEFNEEALKQIDEVLK